MFLVANTADIPSLPEEMSPEAHDFVGQCLVRDQNRRASSLELLQHPFIAQKYVGRDDKIWSPTSPDERRTGGDRGSAAAVGDGEKEGGGAADRADDGGGGVGTNSGRRHALKPPKEDEMMMVDMADGDDEEEKGAPLAVMPTAEDAEDGPDEP
jgi:serine/threonine protein kinase